jgi:hypothetical protein
MASKAHKRHNKRLKAQRDSLTHKEVEARYKSSSCPTSNAFMVNISAEQGSKMVTGLYNPVTTSKREYVPSDATELKRELNKHVPSKFIYVKPKRKD